MDDDFDRFYESEAEEAEAEEAQEEDDGKGKLRFPKDDAKAVEEALKKSEATTSKKKRQATQKPRPKLNEHVMTGERGLPALRQLFSGWQPTAKSPYDNLNEMMKKMEYWAHTLYPQMNFDDFLGRAEQLGKKSAVRVQMMKMRMGMPLGDGEEPARPGKEADKSDAPKRTAADDADDFYNDDFDMPLEQSSAAAKAPSTEKDKKKAVSSDEEASDMEDFLRSMNSQPDKSKDAAPKKASAEPVKPKLNAKRAQIQAMLKKRHEKPSATPQQSRRAVLSDDDSDDEPSPLTTTPFAPTENVSYARDSDDSDSSTTRPTKRAKPQTTPGRRVILSDDEEMEGDTTTATAGDAKASDTENLLNEDDVMDFLFAS